MSLVEAMNQAFTFRKYYLIRRIKPFCTVKPYQLQILLDADKSDNIPEEQKGYIQELCDDHGYSLQLVIPDSGGGGNLQITNPIPWSELNTISQNAQHERNQ